MSERTKLLKKAVLTSVGASTNVERIKSALSDAMQDLVKVGQDLIDDLEDKGKVKASEVETFLHGLKDEAGKKTGEYGGKMSGRVQDGVKKAAKEFGLITREEYEELLDRVNELESALHGDEDGEHTEGGSSKRKPRKKSHN